MNKRDDFSPNTKEELAHRVGFKCSNPDCNKPTSGPAKEKKKHVNVGVAAHIRAATKGRPRYDATMTPEERKSIENGIWLCQNCAHIIDNDLYTVALLQSWKQIDESSAHTGIISSYPSNNINEKKRTSDFKLFNELADVIENGNCWYMLKS